MALSVVKKHGLDHGTTADKVVVLDGAGKLPALDGSQLTNLKAATSSAAGVVELADDTEALAGTDSTRALTPSSLPAVRDHTPVVSKGTSYAMAASDRGCLVNFTAGSTTYSLMPAGARPGFAVKVRNSASTGNVTIDPNGSEQIDGASTLTLSPGQSCWIVSTGSAWLSVGKPTPQRIVQVAYALYSTQTSVSVPIPYDNTTPLNSEGTQIMTATLTPSNANSILKIEVLVHAQTAGSDKPYVVALFRDGGGTAIATAAADTYSVEEGTIPCPLVHFVTAGSTASTTFRVRVGPSTEQALWLNRVPAGPRLNNTVNCSLVVTEIAP